MKQASMKIFSVSDMVVPELTDGFDRQPTDIKKR
jgi:hypothetical protein